MREIASTQEISEHLFVARNGLPPPLLEKLRTSLLDLGDDEQSHAILQSIRPGITGLVAVKDEHYNNLRAILRVVMQAGNAE